MTFKKETDLIKVLGWTISSKIIFILNMMRKQNKTEKDIYNHLVNETDLIKHKSFKELINRIDRIKDDIQFI